MQFHIYEGENQMDDFKSFASAIEGALSMLARERKGLYRTGAAKSLHERLKENAARRLRREAGKVTELDADVLEDLMKIVKKLGKQATPNGNGLETRLKLTLELLPYALEKGKATTPDMLLYRFNEIYQWMSRVFPENSTVNISKGGTL